MDEKELDEHFEKDMPIMERYRMSLLIAFKEAVINGQAHCFGAALSNVHSHIIAMILAERNAPESEIDRVARTHADRMIAGIKAFAQVEKEENTTDT